MKLDNVDKKILSIELKDKIYVLKVRLAWKSWFRNHVREELFYSRDLKYFTHVHTGFTAQKWWEEYLNCNEFRESNKFDTWLNGECYLINVGLKKENEATDVVDEPVVGKLFRAKKKNNLIDKDGNEVDPYFVNWNKMNVLQWLM